MLGGVPQGISSGCGNSGAWIHSMRLQIQSKTAPTCLSLASLKVRDQTHIQVLCLEMSSQGAEIQDRGRETEKGGKPTQDT